MLHFNGHCNVADIFKIGDFYCETCDRQFNSSLKYAEHVAEHETCGLEGCSFTAHPKIVAKHVEFQHLSGLFNRIGKMDSPEDIAKWIADRKRHYPTKENIEKKQAELLEKFQRGERLMRDRSRFNRDVQNRHRGRGFSKRGRGRGTGRFSQGRRGYGFEIIEEEDPDDQEEELKTCRGKLQHFPGTRILEEEEETINCKNEITTEAFSDTEWETADKQVPEAPNVPVASRALSNLMCSYASDASDSENDAPMEVPIMKTEFIAPSSTVQEAVSPPAGEIVSGDEFKPVAEMKDSVETPFDKSNELISNDKIDILVSKNTLSPIHYSETDDCNNLQIKPENIVALSSETEVPTSSDPSDSKSCSISTAFDIENIPSVEFKDSISISENTCDIDDAVENNEKILTVSNTEIDEGVMPENEQNDMHIETNRLTDKARSRDIHGRKEQTSGQSRYIKNGFQGQYARRHRKTLLEKLLVKEILHERNVILQCVRYVIEKEFFGIGPKKNSYPDTKSLCSDSVKESKRNSVLLQCVNFIVQRNFLDASAQEQ